MEQKPKILHIVTKSSWGGAQKYVVDLVAGMQDEYEQIVSYGANTFGGENIFEQKLRDLYIPLRPINAMEREIDFSKEINSFYKLFFLIKNYRPDIIHLNSPKAAGFGSVAGWLLGIKKRVYTVHGLALAEDRPGWQKKLIAIFSWFTFLFATDIIFVSESEKRLVANWPLMKKKYRVIYNGVGEINFKNREEIRGLIGEKINNNLDEKNVIGSIGELTPNKGQSYLLNALSQLENDNWIYVHWGTGTMKEELEQQTKELGLENRVFFLGFDDQAKNKLTALDLFILPSVKEGLGYVLLEAGQASLPVIASRVGGIPEIINSETGVLVEPKNSNDLARAINDMLSDKNKKQGLGHKLNNHVSQNFSLQNMIEQTKSVYTS